MSSNNNSRFRISDISEKGIFGADKTICGISDNWEMVCVLNGSLNVAADETVYALKNNEAILLPSNEFHSIKGEEGCLYIYMSFRTEGECPQALHNKVSSLSQREIHFAEELCRIIDSDDETVHQQFCSLSEFFILCFVTAQSPEPRSVHKDAPLYQKAAVILKDNISNQISVEELSDELRISVSHLKRVFARFALMGVHEYYTALKIAKARELLMQGISVTETAELTGFANQAYFSAAFKRITDISPKDYVGKTELKTPMKQTKRVKKPKAESMPSYLL